MRFRKIYLPIILAFTLTHYVFGQENSSDESNKSFQLNFSPILQFNTTSRFRTLQLFSLNPSSFQSPEPEFRILKISQFQRWEKSKNLLLRGQSWGFTKISFDPNLLNGLFKADGEIAYNPLNDFDFEQSFWETQTQMLNLNLTGAWLGFDYGLKYIYLNDGFDEVPGTNLGSDQEGKEFWLKRSFGVFQIRTFFSDYWDNVDFNPNRARTKKTLGGVAFDIAIPSWPGLGLYYARGNSLKNKPFDGKNPTNESLQTFSAYLYYGQSKWNVTLSSSYSLTEDKIYSNSKGKYVDYELSGFYQLSSSSSIVPYLGLTTEKYEWLGGGGEYTSPMASISFYYSPSSRPYYLSVDGSYSWYKGNDRYTDTHNLNGAVEFVWKLWKNPLGDHNISIEFGYFQYLDSIYAQNTYQDLTALISYKIASF